MDRDNNEPALLSRRAVLRGAALTAGAVPILLAGTRAAQAKATQKVVAYQDTPNAGKTCEMCRSFEAPSSCKTVEGTVSPQGWCKIFIKK